MDPALFNVQADVVAIDKRIQEASRVVQSLKTLRNAKSAINTFPSELLVYIFSFLKSNLSGYTDPLVATYIRPYSIRESIFFTHVCTHWRRLALNTPSLWSDFTFTHKDWTPIMLARSGAVPLTISLVNSNRELSTQLLSHINRIRYLKFHRRPLNDSDWFFHLTGRAPLLETLDIAIPDVLPNVSRTLPSSLFDGYAPKLRYVKLQGLILPWSSVATVLSNVQHLHISLRPTDDQIKTMEDVSALFTTLSSLSQLQTLALDGVFPSTLLKPQRHFGRVGLPSLTNLSLKDSIQAIAFSVWHFDHPNLRRIELIADAYGQFSEKDTDACLQVSNYLVGHYVERKDAPTPRALTFARLGGDRRIAIGISSDESGYLEELNSELPPNCELSALIPWISHKATKSIMSLIKRVLPLDDLRSLSVGDMIFKDSFISVSSFKTAHKLRSIVVFGEDAYNLTNLLLPRKAKKIAPVDTTEAPVAKGEKSKAAFIASGAERSNGAEEGLQTQVSVPYFIGRT
jgi:hypothetical protein